MNFEFTSIIFFSKDFFSKLDLKFTLLFKGDSLFNEFFLEGLFFITYLIIMGENQRSTGHQKNDVVQTHLTKYSRDILSDGEGFSLEIFVGMCGIIFLVQTFRVDECEESQTKNERGETVTAEDDTGNNTFLLGEVEIAHIDRNVVDTSSNNTETDTINNDKLPEGSGK